MFILPWPAMAEWTFGHGRPRQNELSTVADHSRMNFRPWLAMAEWTFRQWPRELWVDWFNALTEPGDWTTRPPQNAVSAVAWTEAQVVNSNSTSAVQDPLYYISWPFLVEKEKVLNTQKRTSGKQFQKNFAFSIIDLFVQYGCIVFLPCHSRVNMS